MMIAVYPYEENNSHPNLAKNGSCCSDPESGSDTGNILLQPQQCG